MVLYVKTHIFKISLLEQIFYKL